MSAQAGPRNYRHRAPHRLPVSQQLSPTSAGPMTGGRGQGQPRDLRLATWGRCGADRAGGPGAERRTLATSRRTSTEFAVSFRGVWSSSSDRAQSTPLTTDNSALVLIDHQVGLMTGVQDYETGELKHNVIALAKAARVLRIPTVVTTTARDSMWGPTFPERSASWWRYCPCGTFSRPRSVWLACASERTGWPTPGAGQPATTVARAAVT